MDRFDRQCRIPGWEQESLQEGKVAVVGRDWLGTFTVLALACMGVGEVLWIGDPVPSTEPMAGCLLGSPSPFTGCAVLEYPFRVEWGSELRWPFAGKTADIMVCCTEDPLIQSVCRTFASRANQSFLAGTTTGGGWYGQRTPPLAGEDQEPVAAMVVAALLADSVREIYSPLSNRLLPLEGPIGMKMPEQVRHGSIVLIGIGGIGVYAAMLSALLGMDLCLVDSDQVEESNLNRQALFSHRDARTGAYKAEAAMDALQRLFPRSIISAKVHRVGPESGLVLADMRPDVILSAVDNARTRIYLASLSSSLGIPLVQAGTDVLAADCYTQEVPGPALDNQMNGALLKAARMEGNVKARPGGCAGDPSYVVPGMLAGAFMTYRMAQIRELYRGLLPIRWRSGNLPMEQRYIHDFEPK